MIPGPQDNQTNLWSSDRHLSTSAQSLLQGQGDTHSSEGRMGISLGQGAADRGPGNFFSTSALGWPCLPSDAVRFSSCPPVLPAAVSSAGLAVSGAPCIGCSLPAGTQLTAGHRRPPDQSGCFSCRKSRSQCTSGWRALSCSVPSPCVTLSPLLLIEVCYL